MYVAYKFPHYEKAERRRKEQERHDLISSMINNSPAPARRVRNRSSVPSNSQSNAVHHQFSFADPTPPGIAQSYLEVPAAAQPPAPSIVHTLPNETTAVVRELSDFLTFNQQAATSASQSNLVPEEQTFTVYVNADTGGLMPDVPHQVNFAQPELIPGEFIIVDNEAEIETETTNQFNYLELINPEFHPGTSTTPRSFHSAVTSGFAHSTSFDIINPAFLADANQSKAPSWQPTAPAVPPHAVVSSSLTRPTPNH